MHGISFIAYKMHFRAGGHFPPSKAGELSKPGQVLEHPHLKF